MDDSDDEINNTFVDPIRNSEKSSYTPDFLKSQRNADAKKSLDGAEQNATKTGLGKVADSVAGASKAETSPVAGFKNSVSGDGSKNQERGQKKEKRKGSGFIGGKGPIGLILALLIGGGGIMVGSQSLLPFSLLSRFTENFDSINVSTTMRANTFLRFQLDSTRVKNPIRTKLFSSSTFKITPSQATKLAAQGITVDDDYNGTGVRVLKFDDGTGNLKVITADNKLSTKLKADGIDAIDFKTAYSNIADFRNGYTVGSRTWSGSVGAWFDTLTANFLSKFKITRNLFADFINKVNTEGGGNSRSAAIALMKQGDADEMPVTQKNTLGGGDDADADAKGETHPIINKDGDVVQEVVNPQKGTDDVTENFKVGKNASPDDIKASLEDMNSKVGKNVGVANLSANVACMAFNLIGTTSLLVSAYETSQILSVTSSYFEAIDKVKAGDGKDSPIHDLANGLTAVTATTDEDGNYIRDGSAMSSNGISAIYGNFKTNQNDPSVSSFNLGSRLKGLAGSLGVSMASFMGCSVAKVAANMVSAGIELAEVVGGFAACIGPQVVACAVGLIGAKIGESIVLAEAISMVATMVIPGLVSFASKALTRDLVSDLAGEDLGNALASGANIYMGNNHRYGGGSLATTEKYVEYAAAQQQVIAENARFERETKSPFDITSKNTFLGSIVHQMMTYQTSLPTITSFINTTSSVVKNSLIAALPTASAYDINSNLMNSEEFADNCPYLDSIGAIGDAFCNPYIITDTQTIDDDPADVIDKIADYNGFDDSDSDSENVKIAEGSKLAKYITYCDGRTSPFGVADQNIANDFQIGNVNTSSSIFNSAANAAIGVVPVLGDIVDVIQNENSLVNADWISGKACVAGNDSSMEAPNWEESKYYQRFIEDQRLAEATGLIEKSAVTAYIEEYEKEHPLDNSFEGVLARNSGLTKETVISTIEQLDYLTYIANYDPSTRYAFVEPAEEAPIFVKTNNSTTIAMDALKLNDAIYFDLRSRVFLV